MYEMKNNYIILRMLHRDVMSLPQMDRCGHYHEMISYYTRNSQITKIQSTTV